MDTLLGSVNLEVSYPHILPLEVIHEVSSPSFPPHQTLTLAGYIFRCTSNGPLLINAAL